MRLTTPTFSVTLTHESTERSSVIPVQRDQIIEMSPVRLVLIDRFPGHFFNQTGMHKPTVKTTEVSTLTNNTTQLSLLVTLPSQKL